MNEQQLGDLLLRAYDSVRPEPFDPTDDLARGRTAKKRRAAKVATAGMALAMGASFALVTLPWGDGSRGVVFPAGPSTPTAVSSSLVTATPSAIPSLTKLEADSTRELAQLMLNAIRTNAAGSGDYLRPWGSGAEPGGMMMGARGEDLHKFGVVVHWSRAGERNTGAIELLSAAAGDPDTYRCGGDRSSLVASRCKLVSRSNGIEIYYGSTSGVRAASISYPDGREVAIIASSLQLGNSIKATAAPLPTKNELVAIVSEPALAWPAAIANSYPLPGP